MVNRHVGSLRFFWKVDFLAGVASRREKGCFIGFFLPHCTSGMVRDTCQGQTIRTDDHFRVLFRLHRTDRIVRTSLFLYRDRHGRAERLRASRAGLADRGFLCDTGSFGDPVKNAGVMA